MKKTTMFLLFLALCMGVNVYGMHQFVDVDLTQTHKKKNSFKQKPVSFDQLDIDTNTSEISPIYTNSSLNQEEGFISPKFSPDRYSIQALKYFTQHWKLIKRANDCMVPFIEANQDFAQTINNEVTGNTVNDTKEAFLSCVTTLMTEEELQSHESLSWSLLSEQLEKARNAAEHIARLVNDFKVFTLCNEMIEMFSPIHFDSVKAVKSRDCVQDADEKITKKIKINDENENLLFKRWSEIVNRPIKYEFLKKNQSSNVNSELDHREESPTKKTVRFDLPLSQSKKKSKVQSSNKKKTKKKKTSTTKTFITSPYGGLGTLIGN